MLDDTRLIQEPLQICWTMLCCPASICATILRGLMPDVMLLQGELDAREAAQSHSINQAINAERSAVHEERTSIHEERSALRARHDALQASASVLPYMRQGALLDAAKHVTSTACSDSAAPSLLSQAAACVGLSWIKLWLDCRHRKLSWRSLA